jgi:hypothetical protein
MLERGRAHPILGPVLLVLLVLLLAMVFVHAAHDGMDAAPEVGAICVALASFFGVAILDGLLRRPRDARTSTPAGRGPPTAPGAVRLVPGRIAPTLSSIPLRR